MSGFAAILNSDGSPVDRTLLQRLSATLEQCGPDHRATWISGSVGLAHALLAFDPEPSDDQHQPGSIDGHTWIVADARIDGREELARKLRAAGREVATKTADARLILHAYAAWGERCVEHLIGDFAFVIWDEAERSLFCARDHLGIAPLYYTRTEGGFLLSNVIGTMREHPAVSTDLSDRAIADFLLFGVKMDLASTVFSDITALPPAHTLSISDGVLQVRGYWEIPEERTELRMGGEPEYVERFRQLFDQAVSDRLRSSRAATHLSGGMDSSSVAVTAQGILAGRHPRGELRAYTVVYPETFADEEGGYAAQVAGFADVDLELVDGDPFVRLVDPSPGPLSPEPGMSAAGSPLAEVSRRAGRHSRATLTGLGGDPLLMAPRPPGWGRLKSAWYDVRAHRLPRPGVRRAVRGALPPRVLRPGSLSGSRPVWPARSTCRLGSVRWPPRWPAWMSGTP